MTDSGITESTIESAALAWLDGDLNPLYCASRGAEALGYPGQSPPARAIPDYLFKDHEASVWKVTHGPDLAPGALAAEQRDYGEAALTRRLRDALLLQIIPGEL